MQHSVSELITMYRECKLKTRKLMAESPWMWKEFLPTLLSEAMGEDKVEEATRTKEILRNEAQKRVSKENSTELGTQVQLGLRSQ